MANIDQITMRILVVEDSAVYRHLLCAQLTEWGYCVEAVTDAECALPLTFGATEPMLLLVDWELPGMSGVELLSTVRKRQSTLKHYVYVLVLTGRSDKADLILALNAGADDYLAKPFHEEEFRARIRVAERTLAVHEEVVNANERLERLASQDTLTELLNRRGFQSALHRERLRAQRKLSPLVLVMCDIDRFKQVNDNFGHGVGDQAIRLVARVLQESSRGSDVAARLGGDEFILALAGSDETGAIALVHRVQSRLRERTELREVHLSLSFGIARVEIDQSEERSLEVVDAALYEAKRAGRDRFFVSASQDSTGSR